MLLGLKQLNNLLNIQIQETICVKICQSINNILVLIVPDPSSVTIPSPSALFCLSNALRSKTLKQR